MTSASPTAGRRTAAFVAAVFALALAPRLWRIDAHLTPDELRWVCRTVGFHTGLRTGDLKLTLQTGHPGVITMWLGGLGLPVAPEAAWSKACLGSDSSELLYTLPTADRQVILARLYAGRRRVAVFTALIAALVALLTGRLLGRRTALVAAPLVALDPFWLAHSRFLHLDAVLTGLMTLSLLTLVVYLTGPPRRRWLIASGVALGLALVAKSPALFMVGFGGVAWLARARARRTGLGAMVGEGLAWLAVAAVTMVAVWPALWAEPLAVVRLVAADFTRHGTATLERASFFAGEVRDDAGAAFYPIVWLLRTSPWVLAGLVLAGIGAAAPWWRRALRRGGPRPSSPAESPPHLRVGEDPSPPSAVGGGREEDEAASASGDRRRVVVGLLLGFVVLFTVFLTAASKEFDRYLLPAFLAADIAAAAGLTGAVAWASRQGWARRWARRSTPLFAIIVLATQSALVLPIGPYWVTWFDPLVGGARLAQRLMLVGWGEGLDQAAAYLNAQPDAGRIEVASRYRAALGLLLRGRNVQTDDYDPDTTDFLVVLLNQVQRHQDPELLAKYMGVDPPASTAVIGGAARGITLAWVYRNRADEPVTAYLDAHADPATDALVVRRGHVLTRRYPGPLPIIALSEDADEAAVASALADAFAAHPRLWFVHRAEGKRAPINARLDRRLQTGARSFAHAREGDLVVDGYTGAVPGALRPRAPDPLSLDFGPAGSLGLRALGLPAAPWPTDRQAALELAWRTGAPRAAAATLSVQLLDAVGAPRAQLDEQLEDALGDDTDSRTARAAVTTHYALDVRGLPAGDYTLSIGAYTAADGDWDALPLSGIDLEGWRAAGREARVEGNRLLVPVRLADGTATAAAAP